MLTEQELFEHAVKFDFETDYGLFSIELKFDNGVQKWALHDNSGRYFDKRLQGFMPELDSSDEFFEDAKLSFEEAVKAMDNILNMHRIN